MFCLLKLSLLGIIILEGSCIPPSAVSILRSKSPRGLEDDFLNAVV
jgi:hypothetical protein